ncbi:hypothetical protein [Nocardia sp. NRRL S-836]|uniref:hypothetical protein n=1 Tax=Nocardia sp. NRRL S-836 TaxID=1519492 RepID=UPI0006C6DCCA|nr:hypothetical protein [Nocardia sp. NRRL S-836]KOV87982.1 hypothetical protein ADL03_06120 [Nocardia sp. NRRL S-836]
MLTLTAASAVVATHRNPYVHDEWLVSYQRDLMTPFGVELDPERLARGAGITFQELAGQALELLPVPPEPDLVVVAHGLPDHYPFRSIGGHVDKLLGGGSENFAISEQGLRAPFTALRVATAYHRSGRCRVGTVVVVEQGTFGNDEPLARDGLADTAAVLVLADGGPWEVAAVPPASDDLAELVSATVAGDRPLVVAGPWAGGLAGLPVHRVARGSYCTSVWLALARHHEEWARTHDALVLCDTDPRTGRSHAALLRRASQEGTT